MKHLLLGAAVSSAFAAPALAQTASNTLPSGAQHGTGISVSTSGADMTVNQSGARQIIDWQSFSIGSAASVRFNQPGASSVVLNRVLGGSASEIFGRLSSNGQVFLSNPNGVLFAPGASVEVGALFATTLSISNDDFMAGRYAFANTGGAGRVVNQGNINIVTPNGYAALAGPQVNNEGVIVASLGTIALAAGDRVTLNMVEGSLIGVSVDQAALNASIVNSGTLQANGGRVILTASSANALLDTVINNTGAIRANRLEERDGQIVLNGGPNGIVRSSGILEADTMIIDGGQVDITMGGPGLPTPPVPVTGGGPITFPDPSILQIPTTSTRAVFAGSFSVSASAAVSFVQPSLPPTTSLLSVSPGGGTIQPLTGVITITGTSGQVGLLPPLPVTVQGAGVLVPPEAFTVIPVSR